MVKCVCEVCGEAFEIDRVDNIEDHDRISFCTECVRLGKHAEKLVEIYKQENDIPEDEAVMVMVREDGPIFVREKEVIEFCKDLGMDESEYMKPEYRKDIN